jgi:phosphoribosyl 1,2-cyclic phosphodiesterase
VRGSTPCQGGEVARYGGNTSCVSVGVPGHEPILLDLGTGARYFGLTCQPERPFRGTCLLSHAHWDHIQGLPFFPPILREGALLDVYAPEPDSDHTHPSLGDGSIGDVVASMLRPPLFPVGIEEFAGDVAFHSIGECDFALGDVQVTARLIPHIGPTLGYRLEWDGMSVAYVSDHQQPDIDAFTTTAAVRELCSGVDLLIHDAQYTRAEFEHRSTWGHSTVEYAVWVAQECEVGALALYHHDPTHTDDQIDRLVAAAGMCAPDIEVLGAREGLTVELSAIVRA